MNRLLLMVTAFFIMTSCEKEAETPRYTTNSAEIEKLKASIEAYENADWDNWKLHYADTAKIFQNQISQGETVDDIQEKHINLISKLSTYGFSREQMVIEQILDDEGRTWVNFWGLWRGTLEANEKTLEIPVHLTMQFVDGKVVKEWGFWNFAPLKEELNAIEMSSQQKPEQVNNPSS